MATKKNLSFEQALARLEEIAAGLEDGSMTLEASLKAYEEGIALAGFCEKTLAGAKLRLTEPGEKPAENGGAENG
jgi:exodeoxyribonuclease VII small subunit